MQTEKMPNYYELFEPNIRALEELGGSGTSKEIDRQIIVDIKLSEELQAQIHQGKYSTSQTEFVYRSSWARTYLKKFGFILNSESGVWSFTEKYKKGTVIDPNEIMREVRRQSKERKSQEKANTKQDSEETVEEIQQIENVDDYEADLDWKSRLHKILLKLEPYSFEKLCRRILRESGFDDVEVTSRTRDGGIDGKGLLKLQNIITFHVVFQCKRYKDSVSASAIRDFRGAMQGRADKGIFITTGTFTADAEEEATRDGATAIDLIDGDELCEMLKRLKLGVTVRMVEQIDVDDAWFENLIQQ